MTAEFEKKFLASTKRSYFHYYRLYVLEGSGYSHRKAIEAVETLPAQVQDIGELLDASTQSE